MSRDFQRSKRQTDLKYGNQVPTIAIPLASYEDEEGNVIPSGTFGPVNEDTHNVYECYICPYTTAQRVIESRAIEPPQQWNPLPEQLLPVGGIPTPNFIGYAPITRLHPDARDAITRGAFEEGDDVAGRLRFNGNLFLKTTNKLNSLAKRFKMSKLTNTNAVKYRTTTVLCMLRTKGNYRNKWENAVKKTLSHIPAITDFISLTETNSAAEYVKPALALLGDILLVTTSRQSQRGCIPMCTISYIYEGLSLDNRAIFLDNFEEGDIY